MDLKSNNIELKTYDNGKYVLDELFDSLLPRYQIDLETLMRESDFTFYSVQLFYYKWMSVLAG